MEIKNYYRFVTYISSISLHKYFSSILIIKSVVGKETYQLNELKSLKEENKVTLHV